MKLFHGSNTKNISVLEPKQADHDRPYVYMTTIDVVAAFYLCNAVEKPYYWFPYGFYKNSIIPIGNNKKLPINNNFQTDCTFNFLLAVLAKSPPDNPPSAIIP